MCVRLTSPQTEIKWPCVCSNTWQYEPRFHSLFRYNVRAAFILDSYFVLAEGKEGVAFCSITDSGKVYLPPDDQR